MTQTPEAIQNEIAKLKEIQPRIRPRTAFGDDNHAAIGAQILVLELGLDDDGIWDRWPEEEDDAHVRGAAQEAMCWRDGDEDAELPSDSWAGLVRG